MRIDLSKDKSEVINTIINFTNSILIAKFPFLKDSSTILVAGSIATDTFDQNSDIDLHIIRSENLEKDNLNKLKEYKRALINTDSNIELRFSRTYEVLEKYLNWNDDYILGEFQSSTILFDANARFKNIVKRFEWYPDNVYKDKVQWLLSEMLLISEKELPIGIERNHIYYIEVLRTKYLRCLLTLVRLLNKKFPVYDKKLFETTMQFLTPRNIKDISETILKTNDYEEMLSNMNNANSIYILEVEKKLKENIEKENLLTFSTKNKIHFE